MEKQELEEAGGFLLGQGQNLLKLVLHTRILAGKHFTTSPSHEETDNRFGSRGSSHFSALRISGQCPKSKLPTPQM